MALDEIVMPESLARGYEGGPEFNTLIVDVENRAEQRSEEWSRPYWRFSPVQVTSRETGFLKTFTSFFIGRRGMLHGFLFHDCEDGALSNELIGTGDDAETQFQIVELFNDAVRPYSRPIHRPDAGIVITVNGSPVTPASIVDGLVTLSSPPAAGHEVRATGKFYVPVRFDTDWMRRQRRGGRIVDFVNCPLVEIPPTEFI